MEQNFPTFLELKQFIYEHPKSTICAIRDNFNQIGDAVIIIKKPTCKNKEFVLAYNINSEFWKYLYTFMKEEYVKCEEDRLAERIITDEKKYTGQGEIFPIVLSIK